MSLHDRLQEAAEHNPLVPLALGLLATIRALDLLLTEDLAGHAPIAGVGDANARRDAPEPALALDDPFVLAALGVVAVRRSIGAWLDTAGAGGSAPPLLPSRAQSTTRNPESITR